MVKLWSIRRDRGRRTVATVLPADSVWMSQWRIVASDGKEPDLNRTQEVAGSSPASSIERKACKRGPFGVYAENENGPKSARGQVLVNSPTRQACFNRGHP